MNPEWTLIWAVLLPLIGSVLIALAGRAPNLREGITLVTSTGLCLLVLSLWPQAQNDRWVDVSLLTIMPGLSIRFTLEPLGLLFATVASGLWVATSVYSIGYMRGNQEAHQTRFYTCFAISLSAAMGIALAGNFFTLFIFYEILTLVTYPLVTHKGGEQAQQGGRTYLAVLMTTSIGFLLFAMIWTWQLTGSLDFVGGGILEGKATPTQASILLVLFMFGIGKAALMPFHRWLPAAMVAPTPVSALLHAVAVVKAGVFTIVKVIIYIFGVDFLTSSVFTDWLIYVSGATILIASTIALRSDNLKRRLAYSTVSQLSYVVIAVAVLAPLSIAAAALHIVAHAFGKITLFFAAGSIYTAARKTKVSQLDGIGRLMPWTMTAFAIGALSMVGIPPAAGFISKWYLLQGAWQAHQVFVLVVVLLSTLLNAAYFLPIVYQAFFKRPSDGAKHGEAPLPILIALGTTAGLTIFMFIYPDPWIALVRQLVGALA